MKKKVLDIINEIRAAKDLTAVEKLNSEDWKQWICYFSNIGWNHYLSS